MCLIPKFANLCAEGKKEKLIIGYKYIIQL